jgi:hypothetical protein
VSTWPDVEGAVRTRLRGQTPAGNRVFFGIPKDARDESWPLIVVSRVGGGADQSDAPVDVALIQLDCWGTLSAEGIGDKAGATALVNSARAALEAMGTDQPIVAGTQLHGANVESVLWLPDPDNDRPRYVVTAEVTAVAVS